MLIKIKKFTGLIMCLVIQCTRYLLAILRRIVSRRSREVFWTVRKTMDLHLHLSVAFRALDKKWGKTIDLDSSAETLGLPCLPAVIERPTTTFSSEEFLRTRRIRATPYSRYQDIKRDNKTNDSFADISLSRIPLSETEATSVDSGLDQESTTVSRLVEELSTKSEAMSQLDSLHSDSLDSMLENRKSHALKHWKRTAKAFIEMRCKRIDSKKLTRH